MIASSVLALTLSILFIAVQSGIPPTWGTWGEYPCAEKEITVGGFVAGGSQDAYLLYPTTGISNGTTFPFLAFAHGMTAGGDEVITAYINVLQFVCSHGYIIAAPKSCLEIYCDRFYEDVITTITTLSSKTTDIDPSLKYADFSKIGVYGHSMGGAATVHVSNYDNLNITCSVGMHPSVADDANKDESKDVVVPMIWFTGSDDTTVPPNGVLKGYNEDTIKPKMFAEIKGASHTSAIEMEATYIGQYFDCMIKDDKNACDYFFDDNSENYICNGKGLPMEQCMKEDS